MRRIVVNGSSGAGKTTFARALADRLWAPHVELDSIFHQPGWQPLPEPEFRERVAERIAGDAWVVDGNYSVVRDVVWPHADTVIYLDLPRWQVMTQLVPRTLRRVITRQELWNGNRERWQNLLSLDPETSLLAWSWTRHALYRERFAAAQADPRWSHIRFVRCSTHREARRLLASG